MTYDEGLAHRVRTHLGSRSGLTEREMFGGVGFMVGEDMCCGVIDDSLVVRVGPDAYDEALEEPHARPFDFTGREMRGWVYVDPGGLSADEDLAAWVERGLAFVDSVEPR